MHLFPPRDLIMDLASSDVATCFIIVDVTPVVRK